MKGGQNLFQDARFLVKPEKDFMYKMDKQEFYASYPDQTKTEKNPAAKKRL